MGSSTDAESSAEIARELGAYLTGTEAKTIADRLADGDSLTAALHAVGQNRRRRLRDLLDAESLADDVATLIVVLRAIEGARSLTARADPLWTMPGHLAQGGRLTSSVPSLVESARMSVVCSTYNFQTTSGLWTALRTAAARPEVAVRLYLDGEAAASGARTPSAQDVALQLYPAAVFVAHAVDGVRVRNHAKFIVVDHRFLLVTSANFSWRAENRNVEFGVLLDDRSLAESIEREMTGVESVLYQRVRASYVEPR